MRTAAGDGDQEPPPVGQNPRLPAPRHTFAVIVDAVEWAGLDVARARTVAESISDDIGATLVDVRTHEYADRRGPVALFDVDG